MSAAGLGITTSLAEHTCKSSVVSLMTHGWRLSGLLARSLGTISKHTCMYFDYVPAAWHFYSSKHFEYIIYPNVCMI